MNVFYFLFLLLFPFHQIYSQGYIIKINKDSSQVTVEPDNINLDETITLSLTEDLNNDGLKDFILNFHFCSSLGDCMYGIFIQQKNGKFTCLYEPEYWSYFKVKSTPSPSSTYKAWKEIIVYERTGKLDVTNTETVKSYTLRYDGEKYLPFIK